MGLVCIAVILLAASPGSAESPGQPDQTITIATGEWAPWTGRDLPYNGFVCRVVEDVFNRAGYEVDFAFSPGGRTTRRRLSGFSTRICVSSGMKACIANMLSH